jgi:hypothetical protein
MRTSISCILVILVFSLKAPCFAQESDSLTIRSFFTEALSNPIAYHNLDYLCNKIGGRLCGSVQAEKAVLWSKSVLDDMEPDTVYLQPVMVPHWERGKKETARVISRIAGNRDLHVCAIGGSVATPETGISAGVVEVKTFEQLKTLGRENLAGKIVFFNRAADPAHIYTFQAYGGAVDQRARGAMHAARFGAVAVIVRSATLAHDNYPHTGIHHYADSVMAIPALSVSTNDADSLSIWLKTDPALQLTLHTYCILHPETQSYNVIGEIRGSEFPEEVIAFGGHIDSWDLGQGAHDDGAGVVQTMEVLRLFKALEIKPKHTLRVVVFMDEEYDQRGAHAYAAEAIRKSELNIEKHLAAIEADRGGFTPQGFSIDATEDHLEKIKACKALFQPYGLWSIEKGGSGVDIRDLKPLGIPLIALVTDSQRYFDYQHAAGDTFDKVNARELALGAAAIAGLVWMLDKSW